MSEVLFIEEIRKTLEPYQRGLLEPVVEKKIKDNILEISSKLISSQGPTKFIEVTKSMQKDWKEAMACDIRFGREDEVQKAITKLLTLEMILSHPSLRALQERDLS